MTPPSPLSFVDGAAYLRELFAYLKRKNPRYSIRSWAKKLDVSDSGFFSRILSGKRSFPPALAKKVAALYLSRPAEAAYLEVLAIFSGQADGTVLGPLRELFRRQAEDEKQRNADGKDYAPADHQQLLTWLTPVLLGGLAFKGVDNHLSRLLARLPEEDRPVAAGVFERLEAAGVVKLDGDRIKLLRRRLRFEGELAQRSIREFHRVMLTKAKLALDRVPLAERQFLGTSISLSEAELRDYFARLQALHAEFLARSSESEADAVYHLSTQFFPLLRSPPDA